jgi:hypothetical protein
MINECGAVGGMTIDGGKESTWREPELVPLCPLQIPHDPTGTKPGPPPATNRLSHARPVVK